MDVRGTIPSRDKRFFSTAYMLILGPTQLPIKWVAEAFPPGLKRPVLKAVHSLASSAEVKNIGAIPPFPHTSSWRGS
jgi:hypothetical protein